MCVCVCLFACLLLTLGVRGLKRGDRVVAAVSAVAAVAAAVAAAAARSVVSGNLGDSIRSTRLPDPTSVKVGNTRRDSGAAH